METAFAAAQACPLRTTADILADEGPATDDEASIVSGMVRSKGSRARLPYVL